MIEKVLPLVRLFLSGRYNLFVIAYADWRCFSLWMCLRNFSHYIIRYRAFFVDCFNGIFLTSFDCPIVVSINLRMSCGVIYFLFSSKDRFIHKICCKKYLYSISITVQFIKSKSRILSSESIFWNSIWIIILRHSANKMQYKY